MEYAEFIARKSQQCDNAGFAPVYMPDFLYDFQKHLVEWAVQKGRAAIFADCGLGKTPMQLVWAENVIRKTNGKVLILTPLAVSYQTEREAAKFGIDAKVSRDGTVHPNITVANYERLHLFDESAFAGVVVDESGILKSYDGKRRKEITRFIRAMQFRLLCTATPSPNDYDELGTSSEALGNLGYMDMLNRFFKNGNNNSGTKRHFGEVVKWRFKGHAETHFWRWVCSWARAVRMPSDIGFDNGPFVLPELREVEHVVDVSKPRDGEMFYMPACGLREQREDCRNTMSERCQSVCGLVNDGRQALVWCNLNAEGDTLARSLPDGVQIKGSDSAESKEERLIGFADGKIRVLITKPKIGAWGLNFQSCNHVVWFPTHSFEQYYQGVRRCWRFGQQKPVDVDIVTTEGERAVMANLRRKADSASAMFSAIVREMNRATNITRLNTFQTKMEVPSWLAV